MTDRSASWRVWVGLLLLAMAFSGCRLPAPAPGGAVPPALTAKTSEHGTPPLAGLVLFPRSAVPEADRRVQATMSEVATAATVSLIHTGTNTTVATTVTDDKGRFLLTFPASFTPDSAVTYYLEAVKGLNSNRPGSHAARVRTLIQSAGGGWQSITAGGVVVGTSTTALSLGAALRHGNPAPFDFGSLLGKVVPGGSGPASDTYTAVPGLTMADYTALVGLVQQALAENQDPVASIGLTLPDTWMPVNTGSTLSLTSFDPGSGAVGTAVVANGTGFNPTLAANVVRFNGAAASTPSAGTGTALNVQVPAGATSGPTSVQVGNLVALGPLFSVPVVLSGFAPVSGSAGTAVQITGSGFDLGSLAGNTVTIGGAAATVTAVTASAITAVVPTGAISGRISVAVAGQNATASADFVVPVVVSSFSPSSAPPGRTVSIAGSGFGTVVSGVAVSIGGVAATASSVSPTALAVTVPNGARTGPIRVTVAGQTGTSGASFMPFAPSLNAVSPQVANAGATLDLEGGFDTTATVNFPGGVSVPATVLGPGRAQVSVPAGATAGNLTVTTAGVTTNGLPFRRASYGLGLQTFALRGEQADYARSAPRLVTARYQHACAVIGNHLYVVGGGQVSGSGALNSVERAVINTDGTLGAFSTVSGVSLGTARFAHTSAVIGNYLYVVGGWNSRALDSVERAAINADGTLGTFSIVSGVTLVGARQAAASTVIGNYLYVFGGGDGSGLLNSVERAEINADGTIGTFTTVSGVKLVTARYMHTGAVIGKYLYAIGGTDNAAEFNSVERAVINADGTIDPFSALPGVTLATGRFAHTSAVVGNHLYVLGGYTSSNPNSVERASIAASGTIGSFSTHSATLSTNLYGNSSAVVGKNLYIVGGSRPGGSFENGVGRATIGADGSIGNFATVSGIALQTGRAHHTNAVIGPYLYVIGGSNGSGFLSSIERSPVNGDLTLGSFSAAGTLPTGRGGHTSAVIGDYLYVIGGYDGGPSYLNSIERAPINPDGTLGAFSRLSITLQANRYFAASVVIGPYLYVIGGYKYEGSQATIERAPINLDGTIGSFTTLANTLQTARHGHDCAVIGGYLYVLGGGNPGSGVVSSIERSPINADGTLGSFTTLASTLQTRRIGMTTASIGNSFFVLGGQTGDVYLSSIESAPLQ